MKQNAVLRNSFILIIAVLCFSGTLGLAQSISQVEGQTQSSTQSSVQKLDAKMAQISSSNNPEDIATLAYVYGFPLVSVIRTVDFTTSPNIPAGPGRGPINTFSYLRDFPNSSFTDIVRPNLDTLYSTGYFDLSKEPLVLKVPAIKDRYYSLQFIDAYSNNFHYIGTRGNDTSGGTYLFAGPNWNGTLPSGMKEIESPTNNGLIAVRIFVNGPDDVSTVHSLQDQFTLTPLSLFNANTSQTQEPSATTSKDIPVAPDPILIPKSGIAIYDEISKDMTKNPPPESESNLTAKFKLIGIGFGLTPSQTSNSTLKGALEKGVTNGEQIINQKVQNLGTVINGWSISSMNIGNFGSDYLLRAGIAKFGLFANSPEEAVYPTSFVDSKGQNLTGLNNYVIHFDNGQLPPVKAFWSLTMYNNKSYLADNPINRYSIGGHTPGLKNNADGSLDIYVQHDNPGKDKESNWLPAPAGDFSLNLRLYVPEDSVLKGQYQYPAINQVTTP